MKNKSILQHIWAFLFALCLVLMLITFSISYNSQDLNYYHNFQVENSIDKVTGKSQEELDIISRDLATYLQVGKEDLLTKYFNEKEVAHMRDVFDLYELDRILINISFTFIVVSLIVVTIIRIRPELFKKSLVYLGIFILLALILSIIIASNFNKYFTIFHKIFFTNDLWLLDPETDMMIQMLPLNFFIGMASKIFIFFAILLAAAIILMLVDTKLSKNKKGCSLCNTQVVG